MSEVVFVLAVNLFVLIAGKLQPPIGKPYRMLLFATATYTGSEPRDGRICQAAMQVAVDTANSRYDLLGDYHIETDFRNEGPAANLAPRSYVNYLDEALAKVRKDSTGRTMLAPLVIGTATACQKISMIAQAHRQVQFTPGCSGPQFTARRDLYPNMYRNRINSQLSNMPLLVALFNLEPKWRQYGTITFNNGAVGSEISGSSDYMGLNYRARGFVLVAAFQTSAIDDDLAWRVRRGDARIMMLGFGTVAENTRFLCIAWWAGVKPPNFVFFSSSSNFIDPFASDLRLPGNCTKEIFMEQIQHTIWHGPFDFAIENVENSTFGYGSAKFEEYLDELTNNSRSPDYVRRHRCFDAMQQAILSMHSADQLLKLRQNKSLKDFETEPLLVLKAVNQSAAASDFIGLRVGRLKYNDRVELDSEPQYAAQWTPQNGMRVIYRVWFRHGADPKYLYNASYYDFQLVNAMKWATWNGKAPQDLSFAEKTFESSSFESFGVLASLIVLVSALTFALTWFILKNSATLAATFVESFAILGILLSNAAALTFLLDFAPQFHLDIVCQLQIGTSVPGVSLITGLVVCRLVGLSRSLRQASKLGRTKIEPQKSNRISSALKASRTISGAVSRPLQTQAREIVPMEPTIVWQVPIFVALNLAAALYFIIAHPMDMKIQELGSKRYDEVRHVYVATSRPFCHGGMTEQWIPLLAGVHVFALILSCVIAFQTRKMAVPPDAKLAFFVYRVASINALTMFGAVFFLVAVLPADRTVLRNTIMAYGLFIYSGSTGHLLLAPKWFKLRPSASRF